MRIDHIPHNPGLRVILSTMRWRGSVRGTYWMDIYTVVAFCSRWHNSITYIRVVSTAEANSAYVIVEHSELNGSTFLSFCKRLPYMIASSPALTSFHTEVDCMSFRLDDAAHVAHQPHVSSVVERLICSNHCLT